MCWTITKTHETIVGESAHSVNRALRIGGNSWDAFPSGETLTFELAATGRWTGRVPGRRPESLIRRYLMLYSICCVPTFRNDTSPEGLRLPNFLFHSRGKMPGTEFSKLHEKTQCPSDSDCIYKGLVKIALSIRAPYENFLFHVLIDIL